MRQYLDAKRQYPLALVLFRMGDFYELFYEDALVAVARARSHADVAIEGRRPGPPCRCAACRTTPPTATSRRLVKLGHRVAICEQVEDPTQGQGRREARGRARRHAGHARRRQLPRRPRAGVPAGGHRARPPRGRARAARRGAARSLDRRVPGRRVSRGRRRAQALDDDIAVLAPREIVVAAGVDVARRRCRRWRPAIPVTPVDGWTFDPAARRRRCCASSCASPACRVSASTGGPRRWPPPARCVALPARHAEGRPRARAHAAPARVGRPAARRSDDAPPSRDRRVVAGRAAGSLLDEIDRTVTPMGGRLLRAWLLAPLVTLEPIRERLDAVEELAFRAADRGKVRETLKSRARPRAAGVEGGALHRQPARSGGAGARRSARRAARAPAARRVPGAARRRASSRGLDDLADVRQRHRGHARRRAAGAGPRRRRHPRRRRRRARRPAPGQPVGQAGDRRARSRRARPHRHPVAEGPLQPRVRLLHRDLEGQPARGARRLHPQADDRRRRALRHAGAEGRTKRRCSAPTSAALERELELFEALRAARGGRSRRACSTRRAPWRRSTCWPAWPRPRRSATTPSRTCTTATS